MMIWIPCSYAQQVSIEGTMQDAGEGRAIQDAAVLLLKGQDSTLLQFTRTDKEGKFTFKVTLVTGDYLIMMEHPLYRSFYRIISIADTGRINIGIVLLSRRRDSLEAVIVTPRDPPPRMRGDTLEFNAGVVKMNKNANVEELLRRLPGIQIAPDGTITINGQKVDRLLVDGEDLFGSNPSLVSQNINADLIDKIQLLDKKSQQSEFTGIDDGTRTKTLNLTLKDSHKHGYFGKVEAGDGSQGYYNANGFLGSFVDHQQLTVLAQASNTGSNGLSAGSAGQNAFLGLSEGTNDPLGATAGGGIPQVVSTGLHYADTWEGKDDHFNSNYQYGHLFTMPVSSMVSQQSLPDTIYLQKQQSHSTNSQDQQVLYAIYDYIPDTLSAIQLSFNGQDMHGQNQFASSGSSSFNDTQANNSERTIQSNVVSRNFSGGLFGHIRSRKKPSRIFSLFGGFNQAENAANGYLFSLDQFFQPNGILLSIDTTDQRKVINNTGHLWNGGMYYTETFCKTFQVEGGYSFSMNNSLAVQSTFGKKNGKYLDLIDSLSSYYQDRLIEHRGTLVLQDKIKNLTFSAGGDLVNDSYKQQDQLNHSNLTYDYLNFNPRVLVRYNINPFKIFYLNYFGSTQQPNITQLQLVQNNNDPLHITLGNPSLRPAHINSFQGGYQLLKPWILNIGLSIGANSNDISTRTSTDSLGRQVSQAVNVSGAKNANLNLWVNRKLKPIDLDLGLFSTISYAHSVNYVNTDLGQNDIYNTSGGFSIAKYVADTYNFRVNTNFAYSYSRSSINPRAAIHYWTQNHLVSLGYFPVRGLEFSSILNYTWREKTSAFDANSSVWILNSSVNKEVWNNRLGIRWGINNILNQNAGISRTAALNQVTENVTNTLGRYWMMSAVYRFSHQKAK